MNVHDLQWVKSVLRDDNLIITLTNHRDLPQSRVADVLIGAESPGVIRRLFLKKTSVAALQATSSNRNTEKWKITLRSFLNEQQFLKQFIPLLESDTALGFPAHISCETSLPSPTTSTCPIPCETSDLQSHPHSQFISENPCFDSIFRVLSEYLEIGTKVIEKRVMNLVESMRIMEWLSEFHSYFWSSSHVLNSQMWPHGGWWRKPLRPSVNWSSSHFLSVYKSLLENFPSEFSHPSQSWESSSPVLQELSDLAARNAFARPREAWAHSTLIHGDVKTCNFFLDPSLQGNSGVIGIDWQWTGWAPSGCGDVVYFIFGGVDSFQVSSHDFFLEMGKREQHLKDHYFQSLQQHLQKKSQPNLYTRENFEEDYLFELLDYFTTVLPYLFGDLTPSSVLVKAQTHGDLTIEGDPRMTSFFCFRAFESFHQIRKRMNDMKPL